jgi:hypothetical protein
MVCPLDRYYANDYEPNPNGEYEIVSRQYHGPDRVLRRSPNEYQRKEHKRDSGYCFTVNSLSSATHTICNPLMEY